MSNDESDPTQDDASPRSETIVQCSQALAITDYNRIAGPATV